jgi:hypothetical protein
MPCSPVVTDTSHQAHSDRLSGWKDIAAYLGKSVRSAQRWEAELGLPVERLTGPDGGQIVQASRTAIDAWRLQRRAEGAPDSDREIDRPEEQEGQAEGPAPEAVLLGEEPASAPDAARVPRRRPIDVARRAALPLAMLAAGLVGGVVLTLALTPVISNPTEFVISGRRILATNSSGRLVWSHELARNASYPPLLANSLPDEGDLDGDGSFDIAVGVSYAEPRQVSVDTSDEVLVFNRRGRLLLSLRPNEAMARGMAAMRGPWRLHDTAFAASPPGRLWLAYSNNETNSTVVLEVTADGAQHIRFVLDGAVRTMAHWRPPTNADYLLIGGTDLTSRLAWVGALDLRAPPARWPVRAPNACSGCPTAPPAVSILLPRSELMTVLQRPSAQVYRLRAVRDQFTAEVDVGAGRFEMYWFDSQFALNRHRFLPQYDVTHREQERTAGVTHSLDLCPERRTPREVLWWHANAGWIDRQPSLRRTLSASP